MKLSTKGRYGLRAMIDIGLNTDDTGCTSIKAIAERQDMSESYLEQLIASLKKSGLVKSKRGAQGGYVLQKKADEIRVGDILRSLEGSLAPVECVVEEVDDKECGCSRVDCCVTRTVWRQIRDSINEVVDSISLQDLIDDYKKMI